MIKSYVAFAAAMIVATAAASSAQAQTRFSQCFVHYGDTFYWSGVVTHPAGEYEERLFSETFGQGFERYVRDRVRDSVNNGCESFSSFSGAESDRRQWMYNYQSAAHIMTDWTDGRPLATGEVSAPPRQTRQASPPAIIMSTPGDRDNRRTPGEIAREEAQIAADRQRAQEQAARAAAVQQEAQRLRERRSGEAAEADARDRANGCGRYRDPNSRAACVSPQ